MRLPQGRDTGYSRGLSDLQECVLSLFACDTPLPCTAIWHLLVVRSLVKHQPSQHAASSDVAYSLRIKVEACICKLSAGCQAPS